MAEVVLFHHAQGLTPGLVALADELRGAGHTVHTPDLFGGRTFGSIEEGMQYAEEIGFPDEVIDRGARAVEGAARRAGLRRHLARCASRPEAGADAAGRARGTAVLRLRPGVRVRPGVAGRGARADTRDGRRPDLRRRRRHRRRPRARRPG